MEKDHFCEKSEIQKFFRVKNRFSEVAATDVSKSGQNQLKEILWQEQFLMMDQL